jgi:hypothetical protein
VALTLCVGLQSAATPRWPDAHGGTFPSRIGDVSLGMSAPKAGMPKLALSPGKAPSQQPGQEGPGNEAEASAQNEPLGDSRRQRRTQRGNGGMRPRIIRIR